ncbi:hypothetical protein D3C85_1214100 [compost metagenome]
MIADHFARHRVDRRFANAQYQPGTGDRADPASGVEANARLMVEPHVGVEQRAVGYVRIVARVLDGSRFGTVIRQSTEL